MDKDLNSKGCYLLGVATVNHAVRGYHYMKDERDVNRLYAIRRKFIKNSKLFKSVVDCMEYDFDKFQKSCLEKIDFEYEKYKRYRRDNWIY